MKIMSEDYKYSEEQMEEVWSWIHDERRCVTTQTVSLTMGLPRATAAALLQDLPAFKKGKDAVYECIRCCWVPQDNNKTVVKLVKTQLTGADTEDSSNDDKRSGPVYSLALVNSGTCAAENLQAAHQKDLLEARQHMDMLLDVDLRTHNIRPSVVDEIQRLDLNERQRQAVAGPKPATKLNTSTAASFSSGTNTTRQKNKVTTAASYFQQLQQQQTTSSKTTTAAAAAAADSQSRRKTVVKSSGTQKEAEAREKTNRKKKDALPSMQTFTKSTQKDARRRRHPLSDNTEEDDNMDDDHKMMMDLAPEEKENHENEKQNQQPLLVGTADDFVGDEDEDEDFLEAEADRKRRNAQARASADTKQTRRRKQRSEGKNTEMVEEEGKEDDDDTAQHHKVTGAMDAFAKAVPSAPIAAAPHKKRRKRLVETTTMDANGYLHTETRAVWEDIPSEDEQDASTSTTNHGTDEAAVQETRKKAPAAKKAPPAAKVKKNMKQGNLMGFFQKKAKK